VFHEESTTKTETRLDSQEKPNKNVSRFVGTTTWTKHEQKGTDTPQIDGSILS